MELKHQTSSVSVGELTESVSALSDELQELKEKMDSKGDAVSGPRTARDERGSSSHAFWHALAKLCLFVVRLCGQDNVCANERQNSAFSLPLPPPPSLSAKCYLGDIMSGGRSCFNVKTAASVASPCDIGDAPIPPVSLVPRGVGRSALTYLLTVSFVSYSIILHDIKFILDDGY